MRIDHKIFMALKPSDLSWAHPVLEPRQFHVDIPSLLSALTFSSTFLAPLFLSSQFKQRPSVQPKFYGHFRFCISHLAIL
jgi:hypothetical protein